MLKNKLFSFKISFNYRYACPTKRARMKLRSSEAIVKTLFYTVLHYSIESGLICHLKTTLVVQSDYGTHLWVGKLDKGTQLCVVQLKYCIYHIPDEVWYQTISMLIESIVSNQFGIQLFEASYLRRRLVSSYFNVHRKQGIQLVQS